MSNNVRRYVNGLFIIMNNNINNSDDNHVNEIIVGISLLIFHLNYL